MGFACRKSRNQSDKTDSGSFLFYRKFLRNICPMQKATPCPQPFSRDARRLLHTSAPNR